MNDHRMDEDWKVLLMATTITGFLVACWSLKRTIQKKLQSRKSPFSKRYITLVRQITKEEDE